MPNEAILSGVETFTAFRYNGPNILFRTSPRLELYMKVLE